MRDPYIKSTSLEQFKADLPQFVGEDGELIQATHQFALDYVGRIIGTPGEYDEDGNELTPPVFVDGEHFNVRLLDESFEVIPTADTIILDPEPRTPARVWG